MGEADLVEEVARIASLTTLEPKPMPRMQPGVPKPILTPLQKREQAARRTLSAYVIEGQVPQTPRTVQPGGDIRDSLLSSGLWPAFVARPFGGPPNPDARPDAIVVTALPLSPTVRSRN